MTGGVLQTSGVLCLLMERKMASPAPDTTGPNSVTEVGWRLLKGSLSSVEFHPLKENGPVPCQVTMLTCSHKGKCLDMPVGSPRHISWKSSEESSVNMSLTGVNMPRVVMFL